MNRIFISYRRDDSRGSAGRLYDDLSDRFGTDQVCRDLDAIEPGADYPDKIDDLIASCAAMVVVIGNQWVEVRDDQGRPRLASPDDFVRREVGAALKASKVVIPVLVEDAVMPKPSQLPEDLAALSRRNALPLSDARWKYDVNVLAERLEEVVAVPEVPSRPSPVARPLSPLAHGGGGFKERLRSLRPWRWAALAAVMLLVVSVVALLIADGEPESEQSASALAEPAALALDGAGNLYVADLERSVVLRIAPDGRITTAAGTGDADSDGDGGSATLASVYEPQALAVDTAGVLYIAEGEAGGIRKVAPDGVITSLLARAPGTDQLLVRGMAIAPDDTLLVATNREVLRVAPDGTLTAVAGSASAGYGGDGGPATSAKLDSPTGLAVAADGTVYIADTGNNRVRKVADGTITTVAGTGKGETSGDGGLAVEAGMLAPVAVAVAGDGTLYIAASNQVHRVTPDGTITRVAGDPDDESGSSGDGGPAVAAHLDQVTALAVDLKGTLYLGDAGNDRVRRITPDGIITTVT